MALFFAALHSAHVMLTWQQIAVTRVFLVCCCWFLLLFSCVLFLRFGPNLLVTNLRFLAFQHLVSPCLRCPNVLSKCPRDWVFHQFMVCSFNLSFVVHVHFRSSLLRQSARQVKTSWDGSNKNHVYFHAIIGMLFRWSCWVSSCGSYCPADRLWIQRGESANDFCNDNRLMFIH